MSTVGGDGGDSASPDTRSEFNRLQAENEELRLRLRRRVAWRRLFTVLLVVVTTISLVGATIGFWVHQTVFDTDEFIETIEPALDEPAFYAALSQRLSVQIIDALDIETKVTGALTEVDESLNQMTQELLDSIEVSDRGRAILSRLERPSLVVLAGPVTDWLESRVELRTEAVITSDGFRSRFPELVRQVHEAAIALARNELAELPNVYIEGGQVRLNLIPIVAEALRGVADEIRGFVPDITLPGVISNRVDEGRQQLAQAIDARLPEDFGQVTIMSEDSLGEVQATANRLDRFVWVLIVLAVLLAALTISVSPRRRRTALQLAIGVILGFVVAAVILRRLQSAILAEISSPDGGRAASVLLGEVLGSLRTAGLIVGGAALVVGVGAYLAGRPGWVSSASEGFRRLTALGPNGSPLDRWVTAHSDLLRGAGTVVAVGVFFLTGLEPIPLIAIGTVLALYHWVISRSNARVTSTGVEPVEAGVDQSDGATSQ